jgi:Tfp pilus assembly protein PilX
VGLASSDNITVMEQPTYMELLRRRWLMIVLVPLLVLLLSAAIAALAPARRVRLAFRIAAKTRPRKMCPQLFKARYFAPM